MFYNNDNILMNWPNGLWRLETIGEFCVKITIEAAMRDWFVRIFYCILAQRRADRSDKIGYAGLILPGTVLLV